MSIRLKKFFKFIVLLLNILFVLEAADAASGPDTDYCSLSCRKGKHTVCARWNKCGPVAGCYQIRTTMAFREFMVKEHNELRNLVAEGKGGTKYHNKGATNMNAVSYDLEMEYIAQCWANVCRTLEHDKCRDSKRFKSGQNIYWGRNKNETIRGVRSWYNEVDFMTDITWMDKFDPNNYPNDGQMRGHYTQLVWAETKYIGCARVRYGNKKDQTQLICNYGPAGNMIGEPIYKRADIPIKVATECKDGKNLQYPALCGTIDPIPTDRAWAGVGKLDLDSFSAFFLVICFLIL